MTNLVHTFLGSDYSAEGAIDEAVGKANEWLSAHQWRTSDGLSCYTMTTALTVRPTDNDFGQWYTCALWFYGPAESTEPKPEVPAYTGKTERLG